MLLILLLIFFSPFSVFADDFNIEGDSAINLFFQATAFTVDKFPIQKSILYDNNDVLGDNTVDVLNKENIFSLTNMGYTRRIPDISDKVYGPPGTRIDILYFYQNNTGHRVDIKEIAIPLSRSDVSRGDLSKIVEVENIRDGKIEFLFSGNILTRDGKYKYYNGVNNIENGVGRSLLLDSWYIKEPLSIELIEVRKEIDKVYFKIKVKNITEDEFFTNLEFKHKEYRELFTLIPKQEKYIEYFLDYEDNILEPFTIFNPNIKEICSVLGGNYYQWGYTDSISVFSKRENDKWVGGGYIQPAVESFCIKRIAYTYKSEKIPINSTEVLGISNNIKKLPQTNIYPDLFFYLFVVLILFLWYAFVRKKYHYEDKNSNTRLCSKGSKNT